jgi:hypothetical protein
MNFEQRWLLLALTTLAACGAPSQNTDASVDVARTDATSSDASPVTDDAAAMDVTVMDVTVMDVTVMDAATDSAATADSMSPRDATSDATADSARTDASVSDTSVSDTSVSDAGVRDASAGDGGGADAFVPDPACMYVNVDDRVVECGGRYRFNRRFDTVPASAACPPYWRVGDSAPASTAEQAATNAGCSTACEFRFMTSVSRLYCGRRSGYDILVGTPARCGTIYSFPEGFFSSVDEHDRMFPCP